MTDVAGGTEARKVVTILFTDIAGSTSLGETLDPEALRGVLSRYFAEMQSVVERHGGTVEKFIGDAVMALFGVPVRHEDDALRAVRAAVEMRARLAELNDAFEASPGVRLAIRTGLNTGEVLAAAPGATQSLVVGDTVNTAARLEQAAGAGEILMGEETRRLVHDAVRAEPAGSLDLKGKAAPVRAWRVLDVIPDAPGWSRRLDAPLVGRDAELAQLEDAFARAAGGSGCRVVTLLGPAGVGKSRLTAEFVARLGPRATVLQGRCLPYGEGITFWPIASVLLEAIGIEGRDAPADVRRRVAELLASTSRAGEAADDEPVADGLCSLLGRGAPAASVQETSWAVRKLLERLARRRPVVAILDDIQWGEPTFLDLLEYLADWLQGAPVLLLCQARSELLDARPDWMRAKANASSVALAPLSDGEADSLIRGLVGEGEVPAAARARIVEVSEGNPLFVEETLRMLVDDGVLRQADGRWAVAEELSRIAIPPTILALITARLDRLEPEQRTVIERASVAGRSFWWGAVSELAPPAVRPQVGACLQALVRKELIRPHRSEIRGEDAFRFTHMLVRDAAYDCLPKGVRAELHERLADWLEVQTRELAGDYEEIVGYHLEQAHRALVELGSPAERVDALGERTAERLAAAGGRAFARGDMPAAVNLLSRATALLPARHPRRLELLPEVAFALLEAADFDRLLATAAELEQLAAEASDARLEAHASVIGLWIRLFTDPVGWGAAAEREAHRAIAAFGSLGDERGLARAWSLLGLVAIMRSQFAAAEEAWWQAIAHADQAGNRREALEGLTWVAAAVWLGPTPAEEGIERCRAVFDRAHGDRKAMATALFAQGALQAGLGRSEEAADLFARARALLEEVAVPVWAAGALTQAVAWAFLLDGRPELAEQELRRGYETLREIGEVSFLSTVCGILAEAIYAQGRYEEAETFTRESEEAAGAEDAYSQVIWRSVRAKCLARQGGAEAVALALASESVRLAEGTDSLDLRRHALTSQAEALALFGRAAEAEAAIEQAVRLAEQKRNLAGARAARAAPVVTP
ncbi:MAG TPA: adenylate/guanylate cyclase domain-containing protein [Solirubrobacteraceae bacterium]|nr:adenylate/guanylate cyclase domain-containing protein [Solirubrobacteraceae bacterium]